MAFSLVWCGRRLPGKPDIGQDRPIVKGSSRAPGLSLERLHGVAGQAISPFARLASQVLDRAPTARRERLTLSRLTEWAWGRRRIAEPWTARIRVRPSRCAHATHVSLPALDGDRPLPMLAPVNSDLGRDLETSPMGRAARIKRERRTGRAWSTVNPWTGLRETFATYLSDRSLAEWEADRVQLAALGYPDRPPEFDTPKARGWRFPSNDDDPAKTQAMTLGCDPAARALGTWTMGSDQMALTASLGALSDGQFVIGIVVYSSAPRRFTLTGLRTIDDAAKAVRHLARALDLSEPAFVDADQVMAELLATQPDDSAAA